MNGIFAEGRLDWFTTPSGDYGWMLLDDTYSPDLCADQFVADISGAELTDGSYARQALTGLATAVDGCDLVATADEPTWAALAGTAPAWVVAFREITTDADSRLMGVWSVEFTPDGVADLTPPITAYGLARLTAGCTTVLTPTS